MLHGTLELARRMDRAEIDFCARAAGAGRADGAASLEVGGGLALCSTEGSPWNKVLGLGLGAPVEDADLDAIEAFYDERGVPVQIELCPLAVPGLAARLTRRGYQLQGFENQLARVLGSDRFDEPDGLRVTVAAGASDAVWLRVVAEGFATVDGAVAAGPPPPDVLDRLTEVMNGFMHSDFERLIAWVGDEPAGAASAYVSDGIVAVTGTSTRPAFRRRGVQQAVVAFALNRALGRAELAMTTTEPGTISQRNFERFGFQVLYTRAVFVLS
jgi:ribosomal protein S18 acetylase RimI-like enzyme